MVAYGLDYDTYVSQCDPVYLCPSKVHCPLPRVLVEL